MKAALPKKDIFFPTVATVLLVHLLCVGSAIYLGRTVPPAISKQKVHVRTVQLISSQPTAPAQPQVKKVPKKVVKKMASKEKKVEPKKESTPDKKQQLLRAAAQALAQVDSSSSSSSSKKSSLLSAPVETGSLQVDRLSSSGGYVDQLRALLSSRLTLPQTGEVKLRLTVRKEGALVEFHVLSATNPANESYLAKALPTLSFPPLWGEFRNEEQHTFILALDA